jgi:hypothetical protein
MYSLESGWWHNLSLTNSMFVNPFMYGYMPAMSTNVGVEPEGGTLSIDSISTFDFVVPFTEQERHILFTNCSYFIEPWLSNWMLNNPYSKQMIKYNQEDLIPLPQPMLNQRTINFFDAVENGVKIFPFINRKDLYDSTNPGFILPPTDTNKIKSFIYHKWNDSVDTLWAWKPENSFNGLWPLEENLAYENKTLLSAGMNGFPLGDLYNWFPEKYVQWKSQKKAEDERISTWLNTGSDPGVVNVDKSLNSVLPIGYILYQNYPNPFNPSTVISYSLPISGHIRLKIFDLLGRQIATLVDEFKQAGTYNFQLSANKFNLSSSIYFYTIQAGNFIQTKKMSLIK